MVYHKLAHCGSKIPAVQALRMGDAAYASLYFFTNPKKKSKCNPLRKEWKLLGLGYATLAKTKINIYCIKRTILDSLFFLMVAGTRCKFHLRAQYFFFFFVPATQGLCTLFFYPSIYIVSKNENENKVVGIIIIRFMIFFCCGYGWASGPDADWGHREPTDWQ